MLALNARERVRVVISLAVILLASRKREPECFALVWQKWNKGCDNLFFACWILFAMPTGLGSAFGIAEIEIGIALKAL